MHEMAKNNKCSIIQPLSEPYKERCDQTYKTAIEKARLTPYRGDEQYAADKLIIEKSQDEIRNASVCLADISENNKNEN